MMYHIKPPSDSTAERAILWADCATTAEEKKVTYLHADLSGDTLQLHKKHRQDAVRVFFATVVENAGVQGYISGEDEYLANREYTPIYRIFPADLRQRLPKGNVKAGDYYDELEPDIQAYLQSRDVPLVAGAGFFMTSSGMNVDVAIPDALFRFAGRFVETNRAKDNFAINLALASLQRLFIDRPHEQCLKESNSDIELA